MDKTDFNKVQLVVAINFMMKKLNCGNDCYCGNVIIGSSKFGKLCMFSFFCVVLRMKWSQTDVFGCNGVASASPMLLYASSCFVHLPLAATLSSAPQCEKGWHYQYNEFNPVMTDMYFAATLQS